LSSFCCLWIVSLSAFLFISNSPVLWMSSELLSASFFSASASFVSGSFRAERRVSSSEDAAAREEEAPVQDTSRLVRNSDREFSTIKAEPDLEHLPVVSSDPCSPV
jgi:hypothetical protein